MPEAKLLAATVRGAFLGALVCGQGALAGEGSEQVPRFEPAPCPKLPGTEELAKASCGYLVVPENHNRPTGRTIRLMVAKYPASSAEKRADPVVYLAGAPGDIAPLDVNGFIAADFIRDRDIYVVSQRGTMFSEPALTCAADDDFARELLGLGFYSEATKRAHLAATEACHRDLAATGADLSAYNSTESAADFADLRKVLGIAAWNVYGMSYGSYLAQTLMRDHPEGIRSVVLDSVLPTTYNVAENWQNARDGFGNIFRNRPGVGRSNAWTIRCGKCGHRLVGFRGVSGRLSALPAPRAPSAIAPRPLPKPDDEAPWHGGDVGLNVLDPRQLIAVGFGRVRCHGAAIEIHAQSRVRSGRGRAWRGSGWCQDWSAGR
jgi:pimeloyl-ACP methyl ester carboxylesterase